MRALAVLVVLVCCAGTFAQVCSISTWRDEDLENPYDMTQPPLVDGDDICVLIKLNTTGAPFSCYNITITRVVMCTGTGQNLLPGDPSNPGATGCNTDLSQGELIINTLYDSETPDDVQSSYNPHLVIGPFKGSNKASFCFMSKAISQYNNVLQVDWHYTAAQCFQAEYNCDEGNCPAMPQTFVCSSDDTGDDSDDSCIIATTAPPTTTPVVTTTEPPPMTTLPPTTTPIVTTTPPPPTTTPVATTTEPSTTTPEPTTVPPTTTPDPTTTAPPPTTTVPATTTPEPTTTEPPTTTPEPTTTAPPPTTTVPPTTTPDPTTVPPPETTTPVPTTTAPVETTPDPTTTTPVETTTTPPTTTTSPPPPETTQPPLEGDGTCYSQYLVECKQDAQYVSVGLGCLYRKKPTDLSLWFSIGMLAFGFMSLLLFLVFALTLSEPGNDIGQDTEFFFVENDINGRSVRGGRGRPIF